MNSLTAAELKRRVMAAIEDRLRRGPVHLVKRNKASAVVVSAEDFARLSAKPGKAVAGMTAIRWLLDQTIIGKKSKKRIDRELNKDRTSWK